MMWVIPVISIWLHHNVLHVVNSLFVIVPIGFGFFVLGPCFVVYLVLGVISSLAIILLRKRELVLLT